MTDELFATEESLSPRLRWMRENRITTFAPNEEFSKWIANALECAVAADTEDEALVHLAKRLGIKLWNEQ